MIRGSSAAIAVTLNTTRVSLQLQWGFSMGIAAVSHDNCDLVQRVLCQERQSQRDLGGEVEIVRRQHDLQRPPCQLTAAVAFSTGIAAHSSSSDLNRDGSCKGARTSWVPRSVRCLSVIRSASFATISSSMQSSNLGTFGVEHVSAYSCSRDSPQGLQL